jgi:hypothetical protein
LIFISHAIGSSTLVSFQNTIEHIGVFTHSNNLFRYYLPFPFCYLQSRARTHAVTREISGAPEGFAIPASLATPICVTVKPHEYHYNGMHGK